MMTAPRPGNLADFLDTPIKGFAHARPGTGFTWNVVVPSATGVQNYAPTARLRAPLGEVIEWMKDQPLDRLVMSGQGVRLDYALLYDDVERQLATFKESDYQVPLDDRSLIALLDPAGAASRLGLVRREGDLIGYATISGPLVSQYFGSAFRI